MPSVLCTAELRVSIRRMFLLATYHFDGDVWGDEKSGLHTSLARSSNSENKASASNAAAARTPNLGHKQSGLEPRRRLSSLTTALGLQAEWKFSTTSKLGRG
ncbi:hypothetical protein PaG_02326 [Moesziomyces aphidis]|uniref:Uncharacterized protein n=1 Tax=Moesziomyces aphidis TaxID=84754 RepID=W3VR81_MOEAP|nr:hypothetical protein PaG_02326 [Moesziomyces aphidis]